MNFKPIAMVDLRGAYLAQRDEIDTAVKRVLDSGWYILGKECEAFEHAFADWCGAGHAIGVGNGTDAITIALKALDIGDRDAVFTVSHTAVATVAAVEQAGATPVLVDIDPETFTIDPEKLEEAIASCRMATPRAVIVVHLYGQPCAIPAIAEICKRHGMFLIEDCAQAHGARLNGKPVGSFGDIASYSFYPTKNLGAFGDGGAVTTSDAALAQRARALRQYGWTERYISDLPGANTRLDEIQAAMLAIRLTMLDTELARRREIAAHYDAALSGILQTPLVRKGADHAYHLYVIRHARRDELAAALKAAAIGTGIHYPVPIHLQKAYAGRIACGPSGLGETERASREVLSLPMHPFLSDADITRIVAQIARWHGG
ncbi:MAG TPA: DegT/DnrJ/EryC1/StrS family aminotransferase [Rhizomicrobium sp.]|nr:DegT/DnrJ/EryC1/StrS family aminotransferase [Rhizomicrobium sp.]